MKGVLESMKVKIGDGTNEVIVLLFTHVIACRPTIRSRDISGDRVSITLLGINRERS